MAKVLKSDLLYPFFFIYFRMLLFVGDLIIGGLFDIHVRDSVAQQCIHAINPTGIQNVEAFLYTIEQINRQNILPRGLKLGNHT